MGGNLKVFQEFLAGSSSRLMLPGRAGSRLMLPDRVVGPFSWPLVESRLLWKLDWLVVRLVATGSRSGYRGAGK